MTVPAATAGHRIEWISAALVVLVLAISACSGTDRSAGASTDAAPLGVITGHVEGCWGYAGPPPSWPVSVAAIQSGKAVATSELVVHFARGTSPTDRGITGDVYVLNVPPGTYDVQVTATSLAHTSPQSLGAHTVSAGQTVTVDMHVAC